MREHFVLKSVLVVGRLDRSNGCGSKKVCVPALVNTKGLKSAPFICLKTSYAVRWVLFVGFFFFFFGGGVFVCLFVFCLYIAGVFKDLNYMWVFVCWFVCLSVYLFVCLFVFCLFVYLFRKYSGAMICLKSIEDSSDLYRLKQITAKMNNRLS